jgi:hypothetical protein
MKIKISDVRRRREVNRMTCMQANVRSMMNENKREEIGLLLAERHFDVMGITESWTHEGIGDAEIAFPGYRLFRKDRSRKHKCRGGGVLLYVKEDFTVEELTSELDEGNESLWVRINGRNRTSEPVVIGVCYKNPTASTEEIESLYSSIKKITNKSHCLIMGDFNFGDIDWNMMQSGSIGKDFMDLVHDQYLTQHVNIGTRGQNILDLVITSEPDMVEDLEVVNPIANSDYCAVVWRLVVKTEIDFYSIVAYDYKKGRYEELVDEMNEVEWEKELSGMGTKKIWRVFLRRLLECRQKYIPQRDRKRSTVPRWMNKRIAKGIKRRNKSWRKFNGWPINNARKQYNKSRNKVTSDIRKAKRRYEEKLATKIIENPKLFYSYVRSKSKTKVRVGPLLDDVGSLVDDNKGMSMILNKYFSSVFTKENMNTVPEASEKVRFGKEVGISDIKVTEEKVEKAMRILKANKAGGVDDLDSSFIKQSMEGLVKPLKILYEKSMKEGEVPEEWKEANITAIFKKGSKKEPANYRPVSLTSHVGKILEKIIKDELVAYLEENKLLYDTQHGFRGRRSCLTNLLGFLEAVADEVDHGRPVDSLYLDFRKAFDTVPHERLLLKLRAIGVKGKLLEWIREWLRGRRQRVVTGGECSEWSDVTSGVPQGSFLGPILFLIFINDIDEGIKSRLWKFADDIKMMGGVSSKEDIEQIRRDLRQLYDWSNEWQLGFNLDKCKVMHIGGKNGNAEYEMGGKVLDEVEEKDLGVIITKNNKVAKQCAEAAKTGNKVLGLIYRTFTNKSKYIMKKLYKSLVRPHLDYCVQAWRPHLKKDIEVLEKVQRRATRMVEGCRGLNYEERLTKIGITTLELRRERADLLEMFKIMKGMEGLDKEYFFKDGATVRKEGVKTRGHSMKVYKKRFKLDMGKYSFGNRVIDSWNALPDYIVEQGTVNGFKSKLDQYLGHMKGI